MTPKQLTEIEYNRYCDLMDTGDKDLKNSLLTLTELTHEELLEKADDFHEREDWKGVAKLLLAMALKNMLVRKPGLKEKLIKERE
jgi:hypothetical protein